MLDDSGDPLHHIYQTTALGSDQQRIFNVFLTCLCVTTAFLCLRFYTRIFIMKTFNWDDRILLLSAAFYIGFTGLFLAALGTKGILSFGQIQTLMNYAAAAGFLYSAYCITFRISLILFFLPFTTGVGQRRFLWGVGAFYSLCLAVFGFISLFQCGAPEDQLNNLLMGHCMLPGLYGAWNYLCSALNSVTDWLFALIPIMIISRIRMSVGDRVAACALIFLASSGSIASIVRMAYIDGLTLDRTSSPRPITLYAICAEMSAGFITVCLATSRPLLVKLIPGVRSGSVSTDLEKQIYVRSRMTARPAAPQQGLRKDSAYDDIYGLESPIKPGPVVSVISRPSTAGS